LPAFLIQLNYLGKRGGFWQLVSSVSQTEELATDFVELTSDSGRTHFGGILQVLDDCGPELNFEKVDIYSDKKIRAGKERIARPVVLPYRLLRSSRSYSYYERID